jgi:hypothetical protein
MTGTVWGKHPPLCGTGKKGNADGDPIAQLFRAATVDWTGNLIHDPVHLPDS